MGAVSSTVNAVVDVAEDVGSTLDDIVIQPTIDVVEGSVDLSKNSLTTASDVTQSLLKGDFSTAEDQLKSGVNNIDNILSETYMNIRDPLEAAAVIGGNYFLPGSSLLTSQLVSEGAQDILGSKGGQTLNLAAGATGGYQGNTANYGFNSTDPNAVGGVTGPDNIDVGGGYNPATNAAGGAATTAGSEVTADQITNEISSGTAPLSSADKNALYGNAGYGDAMTSAQIDAFDKAIASGMTVSQALDYARAGLFVNAIAGDPLGLGGGGSQQSIPSGSTGFAQVPIPAEWKSPTYAASSAPIDLSTIFSNQNMLGGTQWQGLPSQQNMSFNDIFAAGQQQTPMGTPVDINQIVSSILGQAATS